jgi:hypothetical protein
MVMGRFGSLLLSGACVIAGLGCNSLLGVSTHDLAPATDGSAADGTALPDGGPVMDGAAESGDAAPGDAADMVDSAALDGDGLDGAAREDGDAFAPSDAASPEAASDDASSCETHYANDGSSTATIPCQSGSCVVGEQACCWYANTADICVSASNCTGDSVPMACFSAADCAYAGLDLICCLDINEAGVPVGSRCTSSACCGLPSGVALCTGAGGGCPPGAACTATIDVVGYPVSRCN